MILLGVNIDHAATLRQARYRDARGPGGIVEPDHAAQRMGARRVHVRKAIGQFKEQIIRALEVVIEIE